MSKIFNLEKLRQSVKQKKIIWRRHALERMLERDLSRAVVLDVVLSGQVIEDYSADRLTPTALILGWDGKRPVHIVVSIETDADDEVAVITAYEPSLEAFESDYRTRRKL